MTNDRIRQAIGLRDKNAGTFFDDSLDFLNIEKKTGKSIIVIPEIGVLNRRK